MMPLAMKDVATALGEGVAIQPVFGRSGLLGWRVYNVDKSAQLSALGIENGWKITQVCGTAATETAQPGATVCCKVDSSREIDLSIDANGVAKKVVVARR